MQTAVFWALGDASDEQLRHGLKSLLASTSRTEARIIAHIAEVEARQLHLRDGSPSPFEYCQSQLGLSESEAFHRLTASRIARKYPIVFSMIERREIHLSGVCLLRDYLTPGNHVELLRESAHKTKRQVLELLARRFPKPDVKSQIRKLPASAQIANAQIANAQIANAQIANAQIANAQIANAQIANAQIANAQIANAQIANAQIANAQIANAQIANAQIANAQIANAQIAQQASISAPTPPAASLLPNSTSTPPGVLLPLSFPFFSPSPSSPNRTPSRHLVEPTSEARYRIQLNATASLKDKLELLRALMSHSVPSGDLAVIVERALEMALEQVQKRRFAKTKKPLSMRTRVIRRTAGHREHIPSATQRAVAERDDLRCTYVSDTGYRCTAQSFLQIHHEHPWARGGASTPENLRLLCASHNRLLAERDFGSAHIAQCRTARRAQTPEAVPKDQF